MAGAAGANRVTEWCLRCSGELPAVDAGETRYCPHCAAPQLTLPDHLRLLTPEMEAQGARTTGMVPPPRPRMVDWHAAIQSASLVGAVAAVLMVLGLLIGGLDGLGTVWMLASGMAAAWLYGRLRPGLRMDARVGVRIGLTAGIMTVSLVSTVLTAGALVARFGLHRSADLEEWITKGLAVMVATMNSQPGNPLLDERGMAILNSPEGHVGFVLMNVFSNAVFLVVIASATGALAGTMSRRRRSRVGRAL